MKPNEFTKIVKPRVIANKNFNKIFCIGYNKTGTSTLEHVLRLYGYKMPIQEEQEIRLSNATYYTSYEEMKGFCANYDAFQDMPFSVGQTYVAADAIFPNSKFILTERPAMAWYESMCQFHKKIFDIEDLSELTEKDILEKFCYLYPGYSHSFKERLLAYVEMGRVGINWAKLYDREWYIRTYKKRNDDIKLYFMKAPEKLLVIDVTQEQTTERICEFLNIPSEYRMNIPHINKT